LDTWNETLFFVIYEVSALNAVIPSCIQVMSESKTSGSELTAVQDFCRMFDESPLLTECHVRSTVENAIDEDVKQIPGLQKNIVTHLNRRLRGEKNIQTKAFDLEIRENKKIDEIIRHHMEKVKKTTFLAAIWAKLKFIKPDDCVSSMQRKLYRQLKVDFPNDGHYYWTHVYPKICDSSQEDLAKCKNDWVSEDDISKITEKYDALVQEIANKKATDEANKRTKAAADAKVKSDTEEQAVADAKLLADEKIEAHAREDRHEAREVASAAREDRNEAREDRNEAREVANEVREVANEAREVANEAREVTSAAREVRSDAREVLHEYREGILLILGIGTFVATIITLTYVQ
jgi:hypothetical protein